MTALGVGAELTPLLKAALLKAATRLCTSEPVLHNKLPSSKVEKR